MTPLLLAAALAAPRIVTPGPEVQTTRATVRLYAMAGEGPLTLRVDGALAGSCRKGTPVHCVAPVAPGRHAVTLSDASGAVSWQVTRYVTTGRLPLDVDLQGFGKSAFHTPEMEHVCGSCHPMDELTRADRDGGLGDGGLGDGGIDGRIDGGIDGGIDDGGRSAREVSMLAAPCLDCHRETVTRRYQHGPVGQGVCLRCHDPASNPRYAVEWPIRDTCFHCHKDIQEAMDNRAFRHGPPAQGRCTTCHDPHGSDNPFWLKLKPFDLCTNCHPEKRTERHVVVGFVYGDSHPKYGRPHPRKPGVEMACPACHNPHAAQSRFLWQFDATSREVLCRTCHQK